MNKNIKIASTLKVKINKKVRGIDFKQKNNTKDTPKPTKTTQSTLNFAKVRKAPCNLLKNKLELTYLS